MNIFTTEMIAAHHITDAIAVPYRDQLREADMPAVWMVETSCGLLQEVEADSHLDAIIETQSAGFRPIRCEWRRYI